MLKKLIQNIKWSSLILEMLGVIFAILVALWVNQLGQDYENRSKAIEHQLRINQEVRRNQAILEPHATSNLERLSSARKLIEQHSAKTQNDDEYFVTLGYSFSPLDKTEWDVAKLTGALAHMKPEVIAALSQIYLNQDLYAEHWINFTKKFALGNVDINNKQETNEYLGSIQFSTMTSSRLLEHYQEYLQLNSAPTSSDEKAKQP
jgi:hypothetical protein